MNFDKWYKRCNTAQEAYRCLVTTISSKICQLDELKYQCNDYIGQGKMEKITTTLELLRVLEERDIISNDDVDFLTKMLSNVGRKDLVRMVKEYKQEFLKEYSNIDDVKRAELEVNPPYRKAFSGFANCDVGKLTTHFSAQVANSDATVLAIPFASVNQPEAPVPPAQPLTFVGADATISTPIRLLIEYLSQHLTHNWQTTIRNLGIPDDIIMAASYNWPHNLRRQILETLEYWARNGSNVSLESVLWALHQSGRNDIAEEMQIMFH